MKPPARTRTFWHSLRFAFAGVRYALHTQRNIRIHLVIAAAAVVAAFALRISRAEWAIVIALIALIIGLELINTSIEALVDLASPASHPLAKVAKDTAAGAVLVAALGSVAAGLAIFLPRLWRLIS